MQYRRPSIPVVSMKDGFLLEDPLKKNKPEGPKRLPPDIREIRFRERYLIRGTDNHGLDDVFAWEPWEVMGEIYGVKGRILRFAEGEYKTFDITKHEERTVMELCGIVLATNLSEKYGDKAEKFLSRDYIARFASPPCK